MILSNKLRANIECAPWVILAVTQLEAELAENCRLLAMSGEREAKLLAEIGGLKKRAQWQLIETAPKDGTIFLVLIDGLPYKAMYSDGRFVWYMHGNISDGPIYKRYDGCLTNSGRDLWEITDAPDPKYEPQSYLWKRGMENKPTHWMHLPEPPAEAVTAAINAIKKED